MQRHLVALLDNKLVNIAVQALRPVAAGEGVDITSWRTNGSYCTPLAALLLEPSVACTLNEPAAGANGVELWGYLLSQAKWWQIGYLNNGDPIALAGPGQGTGVEIDIIGIFTRIAVVGVPTAGAVTASLAPIETWSPS